MEKTTIQIKSPADTIKVQSILVALMQDLDNKKSYDITIQQHREKRSLNANAYFHLLVNKIAKKLNEKDDEIKKKLVLQYGTIAIRENGEEVIVKLPKDVDITQFYDYAKWIGDKKEKIETSYYVLYKRTHTLNSLEMSKLIDGTVQEAKELGIETLDELELKQLIKNFDNN